MPGIPVSYTPRPYVRNGSMGELLRLSGRNAAEAELRNGAIQAQMWSNLGNTIAGTIQNYSQQRQDRQVQAQAQEKENRLSRQDTAFMALLEQQPNPDPREVMAIYGPQRGMAIAQGMHAFGELQAGQTKDAQATAGRLALGVKALSPQAQKQFWPAIRTAAIKGGLGDEQTIPEEATPEYLDAVIGWATGRAPEQPQAPKLMQRDPTRDLVNEQTGAVVTPGTPAVEKGPAVGSFEDYVVRKYGPKPTPEQIAAARKVYQQADDRPLAPIVIQTGTGPMTVDRGTNTAKGITDATGKTIGATPTDAQRNTSQQYAKAKPILSAIGELSEKINTQNGAMAKISGAAERQKARINLNDDVAEYESLISGFTPLIARALGHTGVLTEQDVQSVKAMFPRPGDSKSLRDRKVVRIEQLMSAIEGASGGSSPAVPDDGEADFDWVDGKLVKRKH